MNDFCYCKAYLWWRWSEADVELFTSLFWWYKNTLIRWKTGRNTKRSGDDDDHDEVDHDDINDNDNKDDDDDDDDDDTNDDDKEDDVYACSCEYFSKPQLARVNAVHLAPL